MQKAKFIQRLLLITAVIVLAIVAMQVYWLVDNYQREKLKLKAELENALSLTETKITMQSMLGIQSDSFMQALDAFRPYDEHSIANISRAEDNKKKALEQLNTDASSVNAEKASQTIKDIMSTAQKEHDKKTDTSVVFVDMSSLIVNKNMTAKDLLPFQKVFQSELKSLGIDIPFELAVRDSSGHIYAATCRHDRFLAMPLKTFLNKSGNKVSLQAAFPYSSPVFRKLFWFLSITAVLILVATYSLSYLIILFFRQKKINELRNDFMNNMTHELKTPISSASIAIEMLENEHIPLSEEKKALYLRAARSEINRLENLVESTLMLTTLEQEEVTLNRSEANVKAWLEEILTGIYPFLERHHAVATFMDLPGGFSVWIDKLHFTNVIHNILENAVKYNDKKIPEIHISARKVEEYVILSITDNGLGISKRDRERIFDKFFRVSQGDKHTTKGYGIGLSYVKTIVTLHGGSIEVKSTPGEGSEFIIKIPQ